MANVTITIRDAVEPARPGQSVLIEVEFDRPFDALNPTPAQGVAMQLANMIHDMDKMVESLNANERKPS